MTVPMQEMMEVSSLILALTLIQKKKFIIQVLYNLKSVYLIQNTVNAYFPQSKTIEFFAHIMNEVASENKLLVAYMVEQAQENHMS